MAIGLPDYLRALTYQFGGAEGVGEQKACVPNEITELCKVEGKGIIYGGAVWLDHTSTQGNSVIRLDVDMSLLNDVSLVRMSTYKLERARTLAMSINRYDSTNFIYSVGLSYGITYGKRVILAFQEKHGSNPTVHYRLYYAKV